MDVSLFTSWTGDDNQTYSVTTLRAKTLWKSYLKLGKGSSDIQHINIHQDNSEVPTVEQIHYKIVGDLKDGKEFLTISGEIGIIADEYNEQHVEVREGKSRLS